MNQKGVFHKTPSSHFYLIRTFLGPNPLSLKFLIIVLLNCDRFDWRKWSNIKLEELFFKVSPKPFFFFSFAFNLCFSLSYCVVNIYACSFRLFYSYFYVLSMFGCLGFSFLLNFSASLFLGWDSWIILCTHVMSMHTQVKSYISRPLSTYAGIF